MRTREVAKNRSLPVGGSIAADPGSIPNPTGIDHVHSFWDIWREIPILVPWVGSFFYSTCGDVCWIRGGVTAQIGGFAPVVANPKACVVPKAIRPNYIVAHPSAIPGTSNVTYLILNMNGELSMVSNPGSDIETVNENTGIVEVDDLIYKIHV